MTLEASLGCDSDVREGMRACGVRALCVIDSAATPGGMGLWGLDLRGPIVPTNSRK